MLVDLSALPERLATDPALYPVLGHWIGLRVVARIPVLDGLAGHPTEDDLKALDKKARERVTDAAEFAQAGAEPDPAELWTDIYL